MGATHKVTRGISAQKIWGISLSPRSTSQLAEWQVRAKDRETNQRPVQTSRTDRTGSVGANHRTNQTIGKKTLGNFAKSTIHISQLTGSQARTKGRETNQKPHQITGTHGTRNMGTNHKMNQSSSAEHLGNFAKSTIQISHQTSGTTVDHLFRTHHRSTDHKSNKVAANHNSAQDIGTEHEENFTESTIPSDSQQNHNPNPRSGKPIGNQTRPPAHMGPEPQEPIARWTRPSAQNVWGISLSPRSISDT